MGLSLHACSRIQTKYPSTETINTYMDSQRFAYPQTLKRTHMRRTHVQANENSKVNKENSIRAGKQTYKHTHAHNQTHRQTYIHNHTLKTNIKQTHKEQSPNRQTQHTQTNKPASHVAGI